MGKQWQSRIFHPPQTDDGRNRDIFPIPRLELDFVLRKRVSRSVARRVQRRGHFSLGVNAAIDSLNSMYFGKEVHDPGTVADFGLLPTSQRNCLKDIVQKVKYLGKPPSCMSSSGALEALRAAACGYSEPQAGVGDVVPMVLEELSLPTQGVAGVDLAASLEEPLKSQVVGFEDWMIQDADAWGGISKHVDELKPYNDPSLNCRDKYLCFLRRLQLSNVLGLSQCVRGRVGSFCVAKKSKVVDGNVIRRQRLVLDCRQVNTMFREPPHTSLGSLAALCELEIPPDKNLFISGGDIKDCFYACTMPPGLEEFFGLMDDLTPREAALVFGGCESYYASLSRRTPVINVLPMGFSWSFYIVQQLHQQSVLRSLSIGVNDLVLDGQPAPSLAGSSGDPVVSMPYCDNVHTISCCKDRCGEGKESIVNDLKELGFEIHEEEGPSELFLTLGGEVDGVTGVVRPTRQRIWNVIYAFKYLVAHVVSRELVQRLLGHAMVICTINRCGMSVFRKMYDFVHSLSEPRLLNKSELKEVRMFIGLVPLLSGDMRKQWSPQVTATDASPEGFGIVVRDLDVTSVKQIGQWQERWRFKRLPVEEWCPRRRALGQNVFSDVSTAGFVSDVVQQSEQYISNNDFPEVPHNILQPDEWSTVCMGKWKHIDEAITIKEGRALVLALRRLARAQWSRGYKHLIFLDNLALTFSVAKGRASNHTLLRINQKISALCLAGGFAVRVRWIPSELNNADGPSRGQIKPGPFAACAGEENGADEVVEVAHSCGQKCEKHSEVSPRFQSPQGRNRSSGGEERGPWEQKNFAAAGEANQSFSEVSSNSWEAAERGGGTRWQESSAGNDDNSGEEKCFEGSRVAIHSIPGDVQEFLYGARSPLAPFGRSRHRHLHGRHDGLDVSSRQVKQRRRKGPCCRGVRFYTPQRKDAKESQGIAGLEEGDASRKPSSGAYADGLWVGNGTGVIGREGNGAESFDRFRLLPSSWRRSFTTSAEHHPASGSCWPAVSNFLSGGEGVRARCSGQSGHLRHVNSSGLERQTVAGRDAFSVSNEAAKEGQSSFQFLSGSVPQEVSSCCQENGGGTSTPLSASSRRRIGGFEFPVTGLCRSEAKRSLGHRQKCPSVHKSGACATAAEPVITRNAGVLSLVSPEHGKGHDRADDSKKDLRWPLTTNVFTCGSLPKRFALELFAGTARISQCLCDLGIPTFPVDICLFAEHDLLNPKLEYKILHWVATGRLICIWLGMPCTSFSRARKHDGIGPPPLRDDWNVWGIANIPRHDRVKVHVGNQLFYFTLRILRACDRHHTPFVLENPRSSLVWELPPLKNFIVQSDAILVYLDFCQFGEQWRKPTTLLCKYFNPSALSRTCTPSHGRCSRSHHAHIPLAGVDASGVFWTLRAQPYPWLLARCFAETFLESLHLGTKPQG